MINKKKKCKTQKTRYGFSTALPELGFGTIIKNTGIGTGTL